MTTTTEIATLNLDLTDLAGDHPADFDLAAVTATADVVEGVITLDHPALDDEGFGTRHQSADDRIVAIVTDPETGGMVTRIDVGPWGEDEEGMDRADKGLAECGLRRVGPWGEDSGDQHRTALVTR